MKHIIAVFGVVYIFVIMAIACSDINKHEQKRKPVKPIIKNIAIDRFEYVGYVCQKQDWMMNCLHYQKDKETGIFFIYRNDESRIVIYDPKQYQQGE